MKTLLALVLFVFFSSTCFGQRNLMGRAFAVKQLKSALQDKEISQLLRHPLTIDKKTAIDVAEIYLFKAYGKKQILTERPYEVYLIDGYWWMMGTLPKGWDGGGFEFIMSAKDGRIIRFTHYK